MRFKKKLTAGALALTLVFAGSACNSDDDQADQTESELEDQADDLEEKADEVEEDVRDATP